MAEMGFFKKINNYPRIQSVHAVIKIWLLETKESNLKVHNYNNPSTWLSLKKFYYPHLGFHTDKIIKMRLYQYSRKSIGIMN